MGGVKMNMREKMAKAIYERLRRDFQDQKPWEGTTEAEKLFRIYSRIERVCKRWVPRLFWVVVGMAISLLIVVLK